MTAQDFYAAVSQHRSVVPLAHVLAAPGAGRARRVVSLLVLVFALVGALVWALIWALGPTGGVLTEGIEVDWAATLASGGVVLLVLVALLRSVLSQPDLAGGSSADVNEHVHESILEPADGPLHEPVAVEPPTLMHPVNVLAAAPALAAAPRSSLQGVLDMDAFLARLDRTQAYAQRCPSYGFAVLTIRLDTFSPALALLGDNARADLSQAIQRRLLDAVRPCDAAACWAPQCEDVVTRHPTGQSTSPAIDAEQFAVVLEGVEPGDALRSLVAHVDAELREAYTVQDHPVRAQVAIGVLQSVHASGTAGATLRDAELALHMAKRQGKVAFFVPDMRTQRAQELTLDAGFRRAVASQQFKLSFEPVLALSSAQLVAVHVDAVWHHPERGDLAPADFAADLALAGCGAWLGQQLGRQAIMRFARWRQRLGKAAVPLLSLALWPGQLEDAEIVNVLQEDLRRAGLAVSDLELRLTEALVDGPAALDTLRHLHSLGLRLALDGLGTASPSLQALHLLPWHSVRIGRCFVAQAAAVEAHGVLIKAVVSMAEQLGIVVRAEGVDTPEQQAMLQALGAAQGQGAIGGGAMPRSAFARWLRQHALASQRSLVSMLSA